MAECTARAMSAYTNSKVNRVNTLSNVDSPPRSINVEFDRIDVFVL